MLRRTARLDAVDKDPYLPPNLQVSWVPIEIYRALSGDILREFARSLSLEDYHDTVRDLLLEEALRRQDIALAMTMLANQKGRYTSMDFFKTLATGKGGRYHDLAMMVWQKICPLSAHETRCAFQWLLGGLDIPDVTRELAVQITRALFGGVGPWIEGDATPTDVFALFSDDRRRTIRHARREPGQYGGWAHTSLYSSMLLSADEEAWQRSKLSGQVVRSLERLENEAFDTLCRLDCNQWQMLVTMLYAVGVTTTDPVDARSVLATVVAV